MDIQAEKLKLTELMLHTNNPTIIERISKIFQTEESQDIWEELSNDQQLELENALNQVKNGQTVPFEIFLEKHR